MKHEFIVIHKKDLKRTIKCESGDELDDYLFDWSGEFIILIDEIHIWHLSKTQYQEAEVKYNLKKMFGILV